MTNEEYIKSLNGIDLKNYMKRILTSEVEPYIDWERWLEKPRCALLFKGVDGTYVRENGDEEPCIVVEKKQVGDLKWCKVIMWDETKKIYLLNVLEENVKCQNI